MRGLKWCQHGVGTSAECDNLAEAGKRFCSVHRVDEFDISPSARQTAGARNKGEGDRAAAGARGEDSGR